MIKENQNKMIEHKIYYVYNYKKCTDPPLENQAKYTR